MSKPKCIDCQWFAWWDKDYCCIPIEGRWRILSSSKDGVLTDESVNDLKLASEKCGRFKKRKFSKAGDVYNDAWEEYIKNKEKFLNTEYDEKEK